jgi:hypothetical protein
MRSVDAPVPKASYDGVRIGHMQRMAAVPDVVDQYML